MKGSPIMLIIPPFKDFVDEVRAEERTQAERMALEAAQELRAELVNENITVSSVVERGDPKRVLVRHAEEFEAPIAFSLARQDSVLVLNVSFWEVCRRRRSGSLFRRSGARSERPDQSYKTRDYRQMI